MRFPTNSEARWGLGLCVGTLLLAALLVASSARGAEPVQATLSCTPREGKGRVLCEAQISVSSGRLSWADLLVVQAPPPPVALEAPLVEEAVATALRAAQAAGVSGAGLTPFLLAAVDEATGGRSRAANLALLEANAGLAAEVAAALLE